MTDSKKYVKNGKKLGVLGGLGPAAAAEFLRQMAIKCPANIDQEHPVIYMIGDCEIPDRGTAILGLGESPLPRIKADLMQLADMGADVLAAQRLSPEGAWMLSTKGTRACGLYQKYAEKHGFTLYIPDERQSDMSQQVITYVKANKLAEAGALMKELVEELWAERNLPVMTACTELPLGYDASGLPQERSVSSIGALVDATVSKLYDEVE